MRTPNRLEVHRPERRPKARRGSVWPKVAGFLWVAVLVFASFFVAERFGGSAAADKTGGTSHRIGGSRRR